MCPIPYSIQPHISGLCVYGYCLPGQSGRCNETKRKVANYTVFRLLICFRFAPIATFYFQLVIRLSFCKIRNSEISYHYYQFLCDCVKGKSTIVSSINIIMFGPEAAILRTKVNIMTADALPLALPGHPHSYSLDNVDKWVLVFHDEPSNCPCHAREDKSWKTQIYSYVSWHHTWHLLSLYTIEVHRYIPWSRPSFCMTSPRKPRWLKFT